MKTDKELGAIRVMEALSAVDGELLERCGGSAAADKDKKAGTQRKGKVYRFALRYAKVCAACLCLIVMGAVYFSLGQVRKGSTGGSDGMMNGAASSQMMENTVEEMEADLAGEAGNEGGFADGEDGVGLSAKALESRREPEWLDVNTLAGILPAPEAERIDSVGSQMQQGASGAANVADTEAELASNRKESVSLYEETIPEEDFAAGISVPDGYSLVEVKTLEGETAETESLLYEWSDGEHCLWLRLTLTELTTDMRFDEEPPVYTVQEEWRELIPDAGEDGYVRFALLYENGMLAEYCGALEKEEIIGLLESLAP